MALRFRKTFKLGPGARLNVGKRSASVRVGGKGFGLTTGTAGTRATASIPGSGLSYTTKLGGSKKRRQSNDPKAGDVVQGFVTLGIIVAVIVGLVIWVF